MADRGWGSRLEVIFHPLRYVVATAAAQTASSISETVTSAMIPFMGGLSFISSSL